MGGEGLSLSGEGAETRSTPSLELCRAGSHFTTPQLLLTLHHATQFNYLRALHFVVQFSQSPI